MTPEQMEVANERVARWKVALPPGWRITWLGTTLPDDPAHLRTQGGHELRITWEAMQDIRALIPAPAATAMDPPTEFRGMAGFNRALFLWAALALAVVAAVLFLFP